MASPFIGKLYAITGGASGIGLATARKLASRGAFLSLADLNSTALTNASEELSHLHTKSRESTAITDAPPTITPNAHDVPQSAARPTKPPVLTTTLDVTDAKAAHDWIKNTTTHFSLPLSGAANMAGIIGKSLGTEKGSTRYLGDDEFHRVMSVHVTGTWNCMRAELPALVEGEEGSGVGGGAIVNAASIAGRLGFPYNPAYGTAKHGIVGLTRCAAYDEGARGIRVNAIAPGYIDTPMTQGLGSVPGLAKPPGPMQRKGSPDEVASLICFLLGDESTFISGSVYQIDGSWC